MRSSTRGLPDEYSQHPQGGTQYFSREPKCAGRLLAKPGLAARRRQASSRIRTEARCRSASSGSTAGCALSRVDTVVDELCSCCRWSAALVFCSGSRVGCGGSSSPLLDVKNKVRVTEPGNGSRS